MDRGSFFIFFLFLTALEILSLVNCELPESNRVFSLHFAASPTFVVDVDHVSLLENTKIQLYAPSGDSRTDRIGISQRWHFLPAVDSSGSVQVRWAHSSFCLTVKDAINQNNQPVVTRTCDAYSGSQRWFVSYGPDSKYVYFQYAGSVDSSSRTSKCLDVKAANAALNTVVQIFDCNHKQEKAQQFLIKLVENSPDVFAITGFERKDRVLDVKAASLDEGAKIQIWHPEGDDSTDFYGVSQRWFWSTKGQLQRAHTSLCLHATSSLSESRVVQQKCNDNESLQRWSFFPSSQNRMIFLTSTASTGPMCLDVKSGLFEVDGTYLQLYPCNVLQSAQQFQLMKLDASHPTAPGLDANDATDVDVTGPPFTELDYRTAYVLSAAVYESNPTNFISEDEIMKRMSPPFYHLLNAPNADCPYLLATTFDSTTQVHTLWVALRGTLDANDVLTDLNFLPNMQAGGKVHAGFWNRMQNLPINAIRDRCLRGDHHTGDTGNAQSKKECRLIFTGHSLGGAVAHLAALTAISSAHNILDVHSIAFGAPYFGDVNVARYVQQRRISHRFVNFVNRKDPVPVAIYAAVSVLDRANDIAKSFLSGLGSVVPSLLSASTSTVGLQAIGTVAGRLTELLREAVSMIGLVPVGTFAFLDHDAALNEWSIEFETDLYKIFKKLTPSMQVSTDSIQHHKMYQYSQALQDANVIKLIAASYTPMVLDWQPLITGVVVDSASCLVTVCGRHLHFLPDQPLRYRDHALTSLKNCETVKTTETCLFTCQGDGFALVRSELELLTHFAVFDVDELPDTC